ncbi:type II toxin-antitoxin system RelE/ParE family toxin [Endozoicomonas sp. ALD040]|uniref:type II toxin-antitoxin system RelE/ParE family toxin n=1 Tax=unclassified Endozoicomonas TaxID=2644528 RepID=UPI003BB1ED28
MTIRVISFYTTEDGKTPVADFLNTLSSQQARKVTWVLKLVQEQEKVPSSYFKNLVSTEEIWEVRVQSGSDIFRLLGFFDGSSLIVLNHAFQKKTQKTPSKAIRLAEKRRRDYLNRRIP